METSRFVNLLMKVVSVRKKICNEIHGICFTIWFITLILVLKKYIKYLRSLFNVED
jgi:hypothetical protein